MKKRILAGLLILFIFSLMLAGCGSSQTPAGTEAAKTEAAAKAQETKAPEQKQEVKQTAPLIMFAGVIGGRTPEEMPLFDKEVQRLSGIEIQTIKPADGDNVLASMLASGEALDLVYQNSDRMLAFSKDGLFEPLNDRIKASSILSDNSIIPSSEWDRIAAPDGKIYGVFNKFEGGRVPTVRWDWMTKLNLQPPKNLDDYYTVLKAFTTQDPDGNGKADTYGLVFVDGEYDMTPFFGAAGLPEGMAVNKDGKIYLPWATEAAAPIYDWFARLYKEGILDPNLGTKMADARQNFMTDKLGMLTYWDMWVGMFNQQVHANAPDSKFEAKGIEPPVGADGKALIMAGTDGLIGIPAYSKQKDIAFKFLEFWHSPEGNILATLGIKDIDYTFDGSKYTLTEMGKTHAMDHGAPRPKSLKFVNPIEVLQNLKPAEEIVKKYAVVGLYTDKWNDAKQIFAKHAATAIMGQLSSKEAIKNLQAELLDKKIIEVAEP